MKMKKIERREFYGWFLIEFESLMVGDIFRIVKGAAPNEVGKEFCGTYRTKALRAGRQLGISM